MKIFVLFEGMAHWHVKPGQQHQPNSLAYPLIFLENSNLTHFSKFKTSRWNPVSCECAYLCKLRDSWNASLCSGQLLWTMQTLASNFSHFCLICIFSIHKEHTAAHKHFAILHTWMTRNTYVCGAEQSEHELDWVKHWEVKKPVVTLRTSGQGREMGELKGTCKS